MQTCKLKKCLPIGIKSIGDFVQSVVSQLSIGLDNIAIDPMLNLAGRDTLGYQHQKPIVVVKDIKDER